MTCKASQAYHKNVFPPRPTDDICMTAHILGELDIKTYKGFHRAILPHLCSILSDDGQTMSALFDKGINDHIYTCKPFIYRYYKTPCQNVFIWVRVFFGY